MTASGYLNQPEQTAERFSDGWYRTGDVMRQDESGFWYFVGRADDMFVCGGNNIYPGAVERELEAHPGVTGAVVVPMPDELKGAVPVAFVTASAPVEPEEIKTWALGRMPAYEHPRQVHIVEQFPLGATNKIDRNALLETLQ